jgi:DNA-directed RNA polymerase specialized sigma24 family protein
MPERPPRELMPSTHWSELDRACDPAPAIRQAALESVLVRYRPALVSYLTAMRRTPLERAEDLVQGFILDKVIRQQLLEKVDRSRGRFRTFLLHVFDNHLSKVLRSERAQRRGGGAKPADIDAVEPAARAAAVDSFDLAWARQVLTTALDLMRQECQAAGRGHIWGVFEARVIDPAMRDAEQINYDNLVERFGFESPAQACNALVTAKRMFDRVLRQVLTEYAAGQELDEELVWLRRVFTQPRA